MSAKLFRARFVFISLVLPCLGIAVSFTPTLRSEANSAASALVPIIAATKSVAVVVGNADADADPGETLEYTVTINNTGPDPATGVAINDTLQNITTLVAGSTIASPVAANDTFSSIGNVGISVPDGASDLLANDLDANNPGSGAALTITTAPTTSAQGGNVSINTTSGSFTYNPPPGFEGADTFTYTLSNGTGLTDTATVTINVSGMIWFINNNSPACTTLAGGCGRLSNPFSTLNAFATLNTGAGNNPAANDNIFIFESATTYSGGVTLLAGQKIIGQDATATLAAISGVTVPTFSNALPAMNTGGNATTLISGGVNVGGGGNTVRGMTISNTATAKIYGTNFGTLTVGNNVSPDVIVSGTGKAIDLNNGTFAATSGFTSVATTSSTSHGMQLISVGGTVAFGSTNVSGSASQGIFVNASNVNLNFGNTTVGATTAGEGVRLENNTGGTRTFGTLSITNSAVQGFTDSGGGNTSVTGLATITNPANVGILVSSKSAGTSVTFANVSNTQSGSHGVHLLNNAGTVTFGDLDISADANQRGILATNNTGTITTTSGTISNTGTATAVEIVGTSVASRTPLNVQLTSVSATGAPSGIILTNTSAVTNGFRILGSGGSCTSAATCTGGAIQNTTGVGVSMTAARNISLTRLFIGSTGAQGISGSAMSDDTGGVSPTFELANSRLTSPGDGDNESAIFFGNVLTPGNVTGRIRVADTVIEQYEEHGLEVYNNTGTLTVDVTGTLTGLTDSTMKFDDNNDTHGQQGIFIVADGTANITSNVSGTYFDNIEGPALDIRSEAASSVVDVNWIGNVSRNGGGPDRFPNGGGFQIVQNASGSATFDINNNNIRDCFCDGVVVIADGPSQGRINNNVISDTFNLAGTLGGDGIRIDTEQLLAPGPGPGNNFTATIQIQGNSIGSDGSFPGIGDDGIQILHRDGTKTLNLTIENNTIANTLSEAIRHFQDADISDGALLPYGAVRVAGNTMTNIGTTDAFVFVTQDTADLDLHVTGNTFPAAGNRNIALTQTAPSVLQITQASVAALAAANTNSTASSSGTITFNSPVTNPPLPTNPIASPADAVVANIFYGFDNRLNFVNAAYHSPFESGESADVGGNASLTDSADSQAAVDNQQSTGTLPDSRVSAFSALIGKLGEIISPTAHAQKERPTKVGTPNAPMSGETVTKSLGTLPAGESIVVKFRATVDNGPYASGVNNITNTATISGSNFSNVNSTTSSIALDAAPDLVVTKTEGGGTTQPSGTVVYTLNYSNATATNGQNAANVVLTETVPANTTFNAAASLPSVWSCADGSAAGTNCTINVGSLNDGASGSATFAVNVLASLPAGVIQVSNTSSIAENPNVNGTDRNAGNNSGPDTTNIIGNWLGGTSTDWFTAANWSNSVIPPSGNNVSIPNVANQPIVTTADVTLNNMNLIGENVTINAGRTVTVNGVTTLGANNINGGGTLNLGTAATITRTTGQVECTMIKNFAATGLFTFPVGTTGAYSPIDVNVTAGTGQLSVKANTGTAPLAPVPLDATRTLQRYWTLSGSGITSNITFNYLNGDVPGPPNNENIWNVIRVTGGTFAVRHPAGPNVILNPGANTFTVNNLSTYSDWTAGEPIAPTASSATVAGQVFDRNGRGVYGSFVSVTDSSGNVRIAITNPFGYYSFAAIQTGQSYVISVRDKRHRYESRVLNVSSDVTSVDFVPLN